jgi:uncharacterized membrane protein YedE/YeeE
VIGFLDVTGLWDPSLALVMGGAIAVGVLGFGWARHRSTNWLGGDLRLPQTSQIDVRLLAGSAVFGVGWGLAGFCPGPAWVSMAAGNSQALIFVIAMVAGMGLFEILEYFKDQIKSQTKGQS